MNIESTKARIYFAFSFHCPEKQLFSPLFTFCPETFIHSLSLHFIRFTPHRDQLLRKVAKLLNPSSPLSVCLKIVSFFYLLLFFTCASYATRGKLLRFNVTFLYSLLQGKIDVWVTNKLTLKECL